MAGTALRTELSYWQTMCAPYQRLFSRLTRQANQPMLKTLEVGKKMKFLDIACGPGELVGDSLGKGAIATGIDYSPEMIRHAREKFPCARFDEGRAEALPYEAASFDAVGINFGLFHFDEELTALAEAYRVLLPGGRIAFTVWNMSTTERTGFSLLLRTLISCPGSGLLRLPNGHKLMNLCRPNAGSKALEFVRFRNPCTEFLSLHWELEDPDDLYQAFFGAVEQESDQSPASEQVLATLRAMLRQSVEMHFGYQGKLRVPMPILLFSAVK